MAKVITIINSKGGVGKTTSSLNIGAYMSTMGMDILLIDADAQCNLTHILCGDRKHARTLYSSLKNGEELPIVDISQHIGLVPGSIGLAGIETSDIRGNRLLHKLLEPHRSKYDYIIIDCPPCLNLIIYNVILASDYILVPMLGEYLSMEGAKAIEQIIAQVNKSAQANKTIGGIFFSRYKSNRGMDRLIKKMALARYGDKVMDTFIHENVALAESSIIHRNIYDYKPKSQGAQDYANLTKEIISNITKL